MFLISHRGNLEGKNPELENSPDYILAAIDKGFEVEVDVWYINKQFYLGHDKPQYKINSSFLSSHHSLWCHAKNREAFELMLSTYQIHCFWHEQDQYTLTSKRIIWSYPGSPIIDYSVMLNFGPILNISPEDKKKICGICSDHIAIIKQDYNL